MRKNILVLFTIALTFHLRGNAQLFPVNEKNKITYYEVIENDSTSQSLLYKNGVKWVNALNAYNHKVETTLADSISGQVNIENEFSLYSQPGLLKKLVGKFTYVTLIEVKYNRYRYTFTDFVFHEYAPDRFHTIIPTGKTRNLEVTKAKGSQKQWDKYRLVIADKIQKDIIDLKTKMLEKPKPVTAAPTVKAVKWDD